MRRLNKELLAWSCGRAGYRLCEASEKLTRMASVVFKLKSPSIRVSEGPSPIADTSMDQPKQESNNLRTQDLES